MIRRIPRKLKKELKKRGINPVEYLKELQHTQRRNRHLDKIFNKDYENPHEIIQQEIGLLK